jgi:hypothetical protein
MMFEEPYALMRARTDLWEPRGSNLPGPPGRGKNREWTRIDAKQLRTCVSSVYSRSFMVPFQVTDIKGEYPFPSLKLT